MAIQDPENRLLTVHWELRDRFEKLAKAVQRARGWDLRVRSGRRTCAEQNRIYAQGRDTSGPIATMARGCRSWHVLGRAIDFDPVDPKTRRFIGGCEPYMFIAGIWESYGGVSGVRFQGFGPCGDSGHIEWHPGQKISDVCPSPSACSDAEYLIATVRPPRPLWLYVAAGVAVGAVAIAVMRHAD